MRRTWGDGAWAAEGEAPPPENALVVDSFLVADGRVRDLARHEERFRRSCDALDLAVDPERLPGFLRAARHALPARGRWFPRLEAHAGSPVPLACWVRPAPPPSTEVRLRVHPGPDPRRRPLLKGPDLGLLAGLREQAREHGADDAVLLHTDGSVLEAAHSGLLWWRGDTLCHPDPELPILPSVTARRVLARARADGVTVVAERCPPSALLGAEVWAVNALHGVRPVVGWQGLDQGSAPVAAPPVDAARLTRFRADAATAGRRR